MKADEILKKGAEILKQRGSEYETTGESERSFQAVADCFNAKTGKFITAAEVALLLQDLKDVRQWSQDRLHEDSVIDCVNYAALKAEELFKQHNNEPSISDKFDAALADGNNAFNLAQSASEVSEKYKLGELSISDAFDAVDAIYDCAFASKNTKLSLAKFFELGFDTELDDELLIDDRDFVLGGDTKTWDESEQVLSEIFVKSLAWRDITKSMPLHLVDLIDATPTMRQWRPDLKKLIELHGE